MLAITEMHKNITTTVQIAGERSEEFEVVDHQGFVLSPLLVAVVMDMDEITKDVKEDGLKELLYVDDLVLL